MRISKERKLMRLGNSVNVKAEEGKFSQMMLTFQAWGQEKAINSNQSIQEWEQV